MSRITNSEKYIICKNYIRKPYLINELLRRWNNKMDLSIQIPNEFINDINKYNDDVCNLQINSINKIMNNRYTYYNKDMAIRHSINWCKKYNIPINDKCIYLKNMNYI